MRARYIESIIPYWIAHVLDIDSSQLTFAGVIGFDTRSYNVPFGKPVAIDGNNIARDGVVVQNTGTNSRAFRAYVRGFNSKSPRTEGAPTDLARDLEKFYLAGVRAREEETIRKVRSRHSS
jgi:hypothetical protein